MEKEDWCSSNVVFHKGVSIAVSKSHNVLSLRGTDEPNNIKETNGLSYSLPHWSIIGLEAGSQYVCGVIWSVSHNSINLC